MSITRNSSQADTSTYLSTGSTNKKSVSHFTLQLQQKRHDIINEGSDYSTAIIIGAAIVIFILAVIIAFFIMWMQRKNHRRKLLLAAELEKEEEERRKGRLARRKLKPKKTPRKKKKKGTSELRKSSKPKTREEMMIELSNFLETHSKDYYTKKEPTVGSAEPTPSATPTATPGLLSSEADVSFAVDLRLPNRSSEGTEYLRNSEQQSTPEVYEKEVVYRTLSTEWGGKRGKKSEAPSTPATPSSKSASAFRATPSSNSASASPNVINGSRQSTPTAIEHKESKENKSRELRSWDLESAEKEGYSEDRGLEPWEAEKQPSEKAEKEDEGLHKSSQENVASKKPAE
ncbi:unnamed protein product [Cylicocyclus nassatus]|uniref:Uncharacterized protein n=1 Tax=Cylicocyclus nassatus TaxID=53992 RepID=A0AA36M3G7_CYLNA|nr:unnamed protein product [Cylicocyclus nassatus]